MTKQEASEKYNIPISILDEIHRRAKQLERLDYLRHSIKVSQ